MYLLSFFLTLVNLGLYLALYTAYSKTSKKLDFKQLGDVIFVRKSWNHTLVEMNKAISLAGLTNLCIALLCSAHLRVAMLWQGVVMLWLHSGYSLFRFYGETHIPRIGTWPYILDEWRSDKAKVRLQAMKKASLIFGSLGQVLLTLTAWPVLGLAFGVAHFYSMELNFKMQLGVRPYGYLPFILAPIAIGFTFFL